MDVTDISLIADMVTKLITPYLKILGDEVLKEVANTAGKTALEKAQNLYETIKTKFSSKPSATEALEDLENKPDDPDFATTVKVQIKKLMQSDEAFAKELAIMVKETLEADPFLSKFSTEIHTRIYGNSESIIQTGNAPISAGKDFVGHDKVEIHTQHLSWNSNNPYDKLVSADETWIEDGITWLRTRYNGYEMNYPSIEEIAKSLDTTILYEEGRNLTETRRYAEAVAYWSELRRRAPNHSEYEAFLRLCLSKVEREMRIDGAVRSLLGQATSIYRHGDFDEAIERINKALMLSPHDKEAFDLLVRVIQLRKEHLEKQNGS